MKMMGSSYMLVLISSKNGSNLEGSSASKSSKVTWCKSITIYIVQGDPPKMPPTKNADHFDMFSVNYFIFGAH